MQKNRTINAYGLFSTVVVTVVGVGIFSYPREVALFVGNDGWIVTIFAGLLSYLILYAAYKVSAINGYKELQEILYSNFGKAIGKVTALVFMIYTLISISIGMRIFIEVVKMFLLDRTPTEFLIMITILTGVYLVRGKINSIVKFNEISFWIMFVPLIFILILCFSLADFTNLLPVLNNEPVEYIKALNAAVYSFAGYEIVYFLFPLIENKKSIRKGLINSMSFITLFYVIVFILCIAAFTSKGVRELLWPPITMIKSIHLETSFIERWEGVVMALWVMFYFTTYANGYYFSNKIIDSVLNINDLKVTTLISAPFIYIIAMYPRNISDVYYVLTYIIPYLFAFNMIILPIILLLISFNKKGVNKPNESE